MLSVVGDLAGVHAQVMSSAELTLWARVRDLEPDAVERALWVQRSLVKTWAMRGTLHLLPAAELGVWVAALSALPPRHENRAWLRHHGLTGARAAAMVDAIGPALEDGPLTRDELATAVSRRVGSADLADKLRGGFGDLLKPAALRGELCFAPGDGRRVRFARPDRWLGGWERVDPDAGRREVARRYLAAYGPAPREQFARWLGTPSLPLAERLLTAPGDEVCAVDVEGTRAWTLAAHVDALAAAKPAGVVALLPAFDVYVVAATRDREAILAAAHKARVYRPQAWLSPVLLVDGAMAGIWSHERKAGRLLVTVEPFARLPRAVRAGAEREALRLGEHLGLEATFAMGG